MNYHHLLEVSLELKGSVGTFSIMSHVEPSIVLCYKMKFITLLQLFISCHLSASRQKLYSFTFVDKQGSAWQSRHLTHVW